MDKFIKFMSKLLLAILLVLAFIFIATFVFMIGYALYKAYTVLYLGRPF